jgi:hypothetical protein
MKKLVIVIAAVFIGLPIASLVLSSLFHAFGGHSGRGPEGGGTTIMLLFIAGILGLIFWLKKGKKQKLTNKSEKDPEAWTFHTTKGSFSVNPFRGILATGGAGSGKTESVAMQVLVNGAEKNFTGLIYDFKFPTLAEDAEIMYRAKNSPIKRFFVNFHDIERSHRVNPLNPDYLPSVTYAREYATAIISNLIPESVQKKDFWTRSATDVLTAVIWFLRQRYPDKCTLPHALAMIASNDKILIDTLLTEPECRNLVISIANAMDRKADAQTAGVISTLQSATAQINTPEIAYILSGDDFSLDINNPREPKVVTIGNYPTLADTFAPVISLIFTVALKWMNQQGKEPSFVLLDEAPTLYIPKLDMVPATSRSNKVAVVYMAQDLSQISDQYGHQKAEVIISNLASQFHGRTTNPKTAQHISNLFGKEDVTYRSVSKQSTLFGERGSSVNYSTQQRERVKVQDMTSLVSGQFVGFAVRMDGRSQEVRERFALVDRPFRVELANERAYPNEYVTAIYQRIRSEVDAILEGRSQKAERFIL